MKEIRERLRYYTETKKALQNGEAYICIIRSRKRKLLIIDEKCVMFLKVVDDLLSVIEDEVILNIISFYYFKRKTENYILSHFPVTHSSFFRMKDLFEWQIIMLLSAKGLLSYEELIVDFAKAYKNNQI